MKKFKTKLFTRFPIIARYIANLPRLKSDNKNAWGLVFYSGSLLAIIQFFIIVELSKQVLLKFFY